MKRFDQAKPMAPITILFIVALLLSSTYASFAGGRTGRAAALIQIVAAFLTIFADRQEIFWGGLDFGVFMVDATCLFALAWLALYSNRYWIIWIVGFQTSAVAAHLARLLAPDIVPKAYEALVAFWGIPMLAVMVAGARKDWRFDKDLKRPSGLAR
jgi:hypothetical protein